MLTVCLKKDYNIFIIIKYILTLMLVAINAKLSFSLIRRSLVAIALAKSWSFFFKMYMKSFMPPL